MNQKSLVRHSNTTFCAVQARYNKPLVYYDWGSLKRWKNKIKKNTSMWLIFNGSAQHQQPYFKFVVMLCLASGLPQWLDSTRFVCTVYEMDNKNQRCVSHLVVMLSKYTWEVQKVINSWKVHSVNLCQFPTESRPRGNAPVPYYKGGKNYLFFFSFSPPKNKKKKLANKSPVRSQLGTGEKRSNCSNEAAWFF